MNKSTQYCESAKEISPDKKFAVINPSRMCQPLGAVQALLGIRGAMPLIHGSQGCSTYMRFQLCRHFREPVNVSSSSMSEATVVYGGEDNLMEALETVYQQYHPEIIGVTSSCLTETIGDDMQLIIRNFALKHDGDDLPPIIPISTPSYAGSHVEGHNATIKSLVEGLACLGVPNGKINIVPGNLSAADVTEIKKLASQMGVDSIILTDTSESVQSPLNGDVEFLPSAGTTVDQIRDTANSQTTFTLSSHAIAGGEFLRKHFQVPHTKTLLPVGLSGTDEFLTALSLAGYTEIHESLEKERGQLIDAMVDAHTYNYQRKVAIYGDPDMVVGLSRFVSQLGMQPVVTLTGTRSAAFKEDMQRISQENKISPMVLEGDLYDLQHFIKRHPVELLIGNSYGAHIAREEKIPLLRMGFPVFDRLGGQRIAMVGYSSGIRLVDTITNTILEHYYDESGWEKAIDGEI